jgi:hypothetical protein
VLHRVFVVPGGTAYLLCNAYADPGVETVEEGKLDVLLLSAGKRVVPKQVQTPAGWEPVAGLLPDRKGGAREYRWRVSAYAGQALRIVVLDEDSRRGCHVVTSGFRLLSAGEFEAQEFSRFMVRLCRQRELRPASRYDSAHFTALSNADDAFSEVHLQSCELLYQLFYTHFRRKGFLLHDPPAKLMMAIFDSQPGFEAYLGRRMSPLITGIYHSDTNRLVVYDYGQNDAFLAAKERAERQRQQIGSQLTRQRYLETVQRLANEFRSSANIGTIMHEAAHQLSFNCGLLNRDGDVPGWLAEGLACYCEATDNGTWLGIGEPNPERLGALRQAASKNTHLIPVRDLVSSDAWLRDVKDGQTVLLGYAQSWALFSMLMEEQPKALQRYLSLISERRTSDARAADFLNGLKTDWKRLQSRHVSYINNLLQQQSRAASPR